LEEPLSINQRAIDIASVRNQLSSLEEWEAFKNGYRHGAPQMAEAVMAIVD